MAESEAKQARKALFSLSGISVPATFVLGAVGPKLSMLVQGMRAATRPLKHRYGSGAFGHLLVESRSSLVDITQT